jgi:PAS domain S-box-containing protein
MPSQITIRSAVPLPVVEERYRLALEAADVGTWDWNLVDDEVLCDERCLALFGLPPDAEFTYAGTFLPSLHPDDRERVEQAVARAIDPERPSPYDIEYRVIDRSDGVERWCAARGRSIADASGRPVRFIGTIMDITARKRLEAEHDRLLERERAARTAIEESERQYRFLAESMQHMVWTADADGNTDYVNRVISQYAGVPAESLYGEGWAQIVHPDDRAFVYARWRDSVATGEPFDVENRVRAADGDYRWFLSRGVPMRDRQGSVIKWFGSCTDIEDLKHAAEERARLLSDAQAASRAKDEFLAMLGHELRNPLAPILTALQLMNLRGENRSKKERTIIERQVKHMVRLVDDLLDVSRITHGKIRLGRERIELIQAVNKAIEMASPLLEERSHKLTVSVARNGLCVDADPVRLAQVVSNLLTNAARYTPAHGEISIIGAHEQGGITVRVRDNGQGIPPHLLPHVFETFIRGDRSLEHPQGGLGLGLTIVRSLIDLHGGRVSARSEGVGRGSEFVVWLPAPGELCEAAPRSARATARCGASAAKHVLVVDDNVDAAELLAATLECMGYVPRVSHDGAAALHAVESFDPDIALLDIGLPVMDGYELARRLRQKKKISRVPMIAVTGYGQESDRERSRAAGFAGHLVKPVDIDALQSMMERLLR